MTRLKDFITSLATVIIRYHDSQPTVEKLIKTKNDSLLSPKSREYALECITHSKQKLESIITECTQSYSERKPLLHYLLHEINNLATLLKRKYPLEEADLVHMKRQLTQVLLDITHLLNTTKNNKYKVSYSVIIENTNLQVRKIDINGLMNGSYFGNNMCNSGALIEQEVFFRIGLDAQSSAEEITRVTDAIINEFQESLFIQALLTEHGTFKAQINALKTKCSTLQTENDDLKLKNQILEKEIEEQNHSINQLKLKLHTPSKTAFLAKFPPSGGFSSSFFGSIQNKLQDFNESNTLESPMIND